MIDASDSDTFVHQEFPDDYDPTGHFPEQWSLFQFPEPNPYFPPTPRPISGLRSWHAIPIGIAGFIVMFIGVRLGRGAENPIPGIFLALAGVVAMGCSIPIWQAYRWKDVWVHGRIIPAHVAKMASKATSPSAVVDAVTIASGFFGLLARYLADKYAPDEKPDEIQAMFVDKGQPQVVGLPVGMNWENIPPHPHFWIALFRSDKAFAVHRLAPAPWNRIAVDEAVFFWKWAAMEAAVKMARTEIRAYELEHDESGDLRQAAIANKKAMRKASRYGNRPS